MANVPKNTPPPSNPPKGGSGNKPGGGATQGPTRPKTGK